MRDIKFKYNVGDYVRFKNKFPSPTTGLVGREGTIAKITGIAPSYNNKPHYYLDDNICGAYKESCFEGLASGSEFLAQQALASGVDTLQGSETKRDTGDSGETEAKWLVSGAFDDFLKCSNCGNSHPLATAADYKYCPHCGKYMTKC